MAGERLYTCTGITKGGVAVGGATHARLVPSTQYRVDPGAAGNPGPADAVIMDRDLAVEIYGMQVTTLLALLGSAAASVVVSTLGQTGAAETITITNVQFVEAIGSMDVPAKDGGGKVSVFGIRGYAKFAVGNVFTDIVTAA